MGYCRFYPCREFRCFSLIHALIKSIKLTKSNIIGIYFILVYNWSRENSQVRQRVLSMTIHDDSNASENIIDDDIETAPTFDPQVQLELNDDPVEQVPTGNGGINSRTQSLRQRFMGRFRKLSEENDDDGKVLEQSSEPKLMSDAELLHKYWKLVV